MSVEEYDYHNNLPLPDESVLDELAEKLEGVKLHDSSNPASAIVVPVGEELVSFTPLQYPWNSRPWDSRQVITHFDYHDLKGTLLRIGLLAYDPMSLIHELQSLTNVAPNMIPLEDKRVLDLLCDPEIKEIKNLPEFGSESVRDMIRQSCPSTLDDLIKVCGLIHGTDIWFGNQDERVINREITLKECMASRDDIFLALVDKGMERELAYKIMDSVRRGRGLTDDMEQAVRQMDMPEWFIGVCHKVRYMFPKAHTVSSTLVAWRLAYYMTYFPTEYQKASSMVDERNKQN